MTVNKLKKYKKAARSKSLQKQGRSSRRRTRRKQSGGVGTVTTFATNIITNSYTYVTAVYTVSTTTPVTYTVTSRFSDEFNASLAYKCSIASAYDGSFMYVSDNPGKQIYKITNNGGVGTASVFIPSHTIASPIKLLVDKSNNLYFTQTGKKTIVGVSPTGEIIDTINLAPTIAAPTSFTQDLNGNFYICDTTANSIYKRDANTAAITLFAGSATAGTTDGTGAAAQFNAPIDLVCDSLGNIYVTDTGAIVGPATSLNIQVPSLPPNTLQVAWSGLTISTGTIRKITPAGVVTTIARGFNYPREITIDNADNLYVCDFGGNVIRKITFTNGVASVTVHSGVEFNVLPSTNTSIKLNASIFASYTQSWGQGGTTGIPLPDSTTTLAGGINNGSSTVSATYRGPYGITADSNGNLYVSDVGNKAIRKIAGGIAPIPPAKVYEFSKIFSAKVITLPI